MKAIRTKLLTAACIAVLAIAACFALTQSGMPAFARAQTPALEATTDAAAQEQTFLTETQETAALSVVGDDKVYRGSSVTYTTSTPGGGFVVFSIDREYADVGDPQIVGDTVYVTLTVKNDAPLYATFILTATDIMTNAVTNAVGTKEIMIVPVFAEAIGEVVLFAGDEPFNPNTGAMSPGDTVSVNIRSFKVNEEIYGLGNTVTYNDFAIVLDSSGANFADLNATHTGFTIRERLTEDAPVIRFSIVVIQPNAPNEYKRLVKEMSFSVRIPVKSISANGTQGLVARGETYTYAITYNDDNVATQKEYSREDPIGETTLFTLGGDNKTTLTVTVSEKAKCGEKIEITLYSKENPSARTRVALEVKALETSYTPEYSKDFQDGSSDDGVQLVRNNNTTQLRSNYKARVMLRGASGTLYSFDDLRAQGVEVDIVNEESSFFRIYYEGLIDCLASTPAFTNGDVTHLQYSVTVRDGTVKYDAFSERVNVFKPIKGYTGGKLTVDGRDTDILRDTRAEICYTPNNTGITAQSASDYDYTVNSSYFSLQKGSAVTLQVTNPASVSAGCVITVRNAATYNGVNLDSSWSKSFSLYRRFIASADHLRALNGASEDYYLVNDVVLSGKWTPIPDFYGTLYGQDKTVSRMSVSTSANSADVGLFALNHGAVKNLKVHGEIRIADGGDFVYGGLIAGRNYGAIVNCTAMAYDGYAIRSDRDASCVGGIAGINHGEIDRCDNRAKIYGRGDIGGIAGQNQYSDSVQDYYSAAIKSSQNQGDLEYDFHTNNRSIGGITGYQDHGSLYSCFNSAVIRYVSPSSASRDLAPAIGQIVGRAMQVPGAYCSGNGSVDKGSLHVETWKGGFLWTQTYTHDQAKYVSNDAVGHLWES